MAHKTEIDRLYAIAQAADDKFQAAVIRQFGRKNAGTMRYVSSKHNEATKAAATAYWEAANAAVSAMQDARKEGRQ